MAGEEKEEAAVAGAPAKKAPAQKAAAKRAPAKKPAAKPRANPAPEIVASPLNVSSFDARGERRPCTDIPARITDLADDPHRSLAGLLRSAGGFAKDASPFAEFLWADYLRPHISRAQIRKTLDAALREAQGLAKSPLARYLPGWSGVMLAPVELAR